VTDWSSEEEWVKDGAREVWNHLERRKDEKHSDMQTGGFMLIDKWFQLKKNYVWNVHIPLIEGSAPWKKFDWERTVFFKAFKCSVVTAVLVYSVIVFPFIDVALKLCTCLKNALCVCQSNNSSFFSRKIFPFQTDLFFPINNPSIFYEFYHQIWILPKMMNVLWFSASQIQMSDFLKISFNGNLWSWWGGRLKSVAGLKSQGNSGDLGKEECPSPQNVR